MVISQNVYSQTDSLVPIQTTYLRLISSPKEYNGKRIIVDGFLHVKPEDYSLYFSKDNANLLIPECIMIDFDSSFIKKNNILSYDGKFVSIQGVFLYNDKLGVLYRERIINTSVLKVLKKVYKN